MTEFGIACVLLGLSVFLLVGSWALVVIVCDTMGWFKRD
jgi:hypothetical protein